MWGKKKDDDLLPQAAAPAPKSYMEQELLRQGHDPAEIARHYSEMQAQRDREMANAAAYMGALTNQHMAGHAADAFAYASRARRNETINEVLWKTLLSAHVIHDFGPTKGLEIMEHVKIKSVDSVMTMSKQIIVIYKNGDVENEIKVDVDDTEIEKLGDGKALEVMDRVSPLLGMLHG